MPRVSPQDRLQPSLLDRLTDDDPGATAESATVGVLTMHQLRACVLRDLEWLLNTGNLELVEELDDYPLVADSTLNYGVPTLSGVYASRLAANDIERRLRQALWRFEPRIVRDSIKVKIVTAPDPTTHNAVTLCIEGVLWAEPVPWQLFLKTEIDLDTGAVAITEQAAGNEH